MKKFLAILIILLMFSEIIWAQGNFQSPDIPRASVYTYSGTMGKTEQLKIYTYIWGRVRNPGLYIVPDDTDLIALISLAGGPTDGAKLSRIRIIHSGANGESEDVVWINLKKFIDDGDSSDIPVLRPGDTVIVSGTTFYGAAKVADFLSKIAVVLSVYNLYINLTD
ncbi:MAG: SLBB domain-containing protein [Candidatus Cloacimonetes bacterium]|nr:SLBB domain-containing protein [Candidatus Cloacimonadota bacterium]